jgi:hypothetical protein
MFIQSTAIAVVASNATPARAWLVHFALSRKAIQLTNLDESSLSWRETLKMHVLSKS